MSEILVVYGRQTRFFLILDCGHWYKWTGREAPPPNGDDFPCPSCSPTAVVTGAVTSTTVS